MVTLGYYSVALQRPKSGGEFCGDKQIYSPGINGVCVPGEGGVRFGRGWVFSSWQWGAQLLTAYCFLRAYLFELF